MKGRGFSRLFEYVASDCDPIFPSLEVHMEMRDAGPSCGYWLYQSLWVTVYICLSNGRFRPGVDRLDLAQGS